jgi:S-adenosyl methyltransferase
VRGRRLNDSMTQRFTMRTRAQVTGFFHGLFHGLALAEPGVVPTREWRPDPGDDPGQRGVPWAGRRP